LALTPVVATGTFVIPAGTVSPLLLPFGYVLPGAAGASAFSTTSSTFTAPASGNYRLSVYVVSQLTSPASAQNFLLYAVVDGTSLWLSAYGPTADAAITASLEVICYLAAGQTLWIAGASTEGCTLSFNSNGTTPFTAALSIESLF
jgi:hypothetical protein